MNKTQGTVKWFSAPKGYGFITDAAGNEHFVHQTDIITEGFRSLRDGEAVEFVVETSGDGRTKAVQVTGPGGAPPEGTPRRDFGDMGGGFGGGFGGRGGGYGGGYGAGGGYGNSYGGGMGGGYGQPAYGGNQGGYGGSGGFNQGGYGGGGGFGGQQGGYNGNQGYGNRGF